MILSGAVGVKMLAGVKMLGGQVCAIKNNVFAQAFKNMSLFSFVLKKV